MTELDKLIAEQAADDSSNFVNIKYLGANPIASLSPERLLSVSDDIQAKRQYANRISWGEPAQICQAVIDNQCPVCGATSKDIYYENNHLLAGYESGDGYALCSCGWSWCSESVVFKT